MDLFLEENKMLDKLAGIMSRSFDPKNQKIKDFKATLIFPEDVANSLEEIIAGDESKRVTLGEMLSCLIADGVTTRLYLKIPRDIAAGDIAAGD